MISVTVAVAVVAGGIAVAVAVVRTRQIDRAAAQNARVRNARRRADAEAGSDYEEWR